MKLAMKVAFFTVTLLTVLLILGLSLSRGSTLPIRDNKGNIIPNSIATLEKVKLGGMQQWILIRGEDISNPVLLWLHGGPGSSQMPVAHNFDKRLEKEFIVVHWDQRGAGKSNPPDFREETMTFEQFVSDAHQLTQYLKRYLNKQKVYLIGHSWGTQLGIKLAYQYPEDYYAYIGVSQVVSNTLSQKIAYNWLAREIEKNGDGTSLKKLKNLGLPPYTNHKEYVSFVRLVDSYGGGFDIGFKELFRIALKAPEYRLKDYVWWLKGSTRGSGPMWETETYQSFNALKHFPKLLIPVYFFNGKNDYNTPVKLVEEYFKGLEAPKGKELVIFNNSAHTPFLGEPQKFAKEMLRVKSETCK